MKNKKNVIYVSTSLLLMLTVFFAAIGYANKIEEKQELMKVEEEEYKKTYGAEYFDYILSHSSKEAILKSNEVLDKIKDYPSYNQNGLKEKVISQLNLSTSVFLDNDDITGEDLDDISLAFYGDYISEENKERYEYLVKFFDTKVEEDTANKGTGSNSLVLTEVGMADYELREAYGEPNRKSVTSTISGVEEIWYYDSKVFYLSDKYVYETVYY